MIKAQEQDTICKQRNIVVLILEPCALRIISYLCTLHECTGFVASISEHPPSFSIDGQTIFFPTAKNLS